MKCKVALFAALLLAVGIGGCSSVQPKRVGASQTAVLTDQTIQAAIQKDLLSDLGPSSRTISVDVKQGIATLSGSANTLLEKQRAIDLAGTIKGVRSIVDLIVVTPEKVSDRSILAQVMKGLETSPAMSSKRWTVNVKYGEVTLTGTGSRTEHDLASQIASNVPGVKQVNNEIRVVYPYPRPDAAILADVTARLNSDLWLAKQPIQVAVNDGKVSLSGTVESLYQKKRAFQDAWVDGAVKVSDNDLNVTGQQPMLQRANGPITRSDTQILEDVERAFRYDPRVNPNGIRVQVLEGGVTLNGSVGDFLARQAAEEDAKETAGVTGVRNFLNIKPLELTPDYKLQRQVLSALSNSPFPDLRRVNVRVYQGTVILTGMVSSPLEKRYVDNTIGQINGVSLLKNELTVNTLGVSQQNDLALKNDIEQRFRMDPYIDPAQINVMVTQGTVTLAGRINNWFEGASAVKDAYLAGAPLVNDELRVRSAQNVGE